VEKKKQSRPALLPGVGMMDAEALVPRDVDVEPVLG
jgi:hypothetical protein